MTDADEHEPDGTPPPSPAPAAEPPVAPPAGVPPTAPAAPSAPQPPPPSSAPGPPGPPESRAPFAPRPFTVGPGQLIVLLGIAAVVASMLLHWLDFTVSIAGLRRNSTANAWDVPAAFLFDYKTNSNDPSLLIVLVPIAALALADVFLFRHRVVTFLAGIATLATVGLYAYQLDRTANRIAEASRNILNPSVTDLAGLAPYVALVGGILLLVGAVLTRPAPSFRPAATTADGPVYPPRLPTAPPRTAVDAPPSVDDSEVPPPV